jgi:hypothetical protein
MMADVNATSAAASPIDDGERQTIRDQIREILQENWVGQRRAINSQIHRALWLKRARKGSLFQLAGSW